MIIVRVGLGVSTDDVEKSVSRDTMQRNTGFGASHLTREIQFRDGPLTADDGTLEDGIMFAGDKAV